VDVTDEIPVEEDDAMEPFDVDDIGMGDFDDEEDDAEDDFDYPLHGPRFRRGQSPEPELSDDDEDDEDGWVDVHALPKRPFPQRIRRSPEPLRDEVTEDDDMFSARPRRRSTPSYEPSFTAYEAPRRPAGRPPRPAQPRRPEPYYEPERRYRPEPGYYGEDTYSADSGEDAYLESLLEEMLNRRRKRPR
jgi:hypothetical protein